MRPVHDWNYAPYSSSQQHNLVINYTWDLPKAESLGSNALIRHVLGDWQLSGENAFVSGDWTAVNLATTDNFDFTGGDGGNGGDIGGGVRTVRPNIVSNPTSGSRNPTPGEPGSWLNVSAFARPAGRGDYGSAPRTVFQLPPIRNWNLALFKNFPIGGKRRLQFRWEVYNVLNSVQFDLMDSTARFDASGAQVNQNFGKATRARNARIMQGALRFVF